MIDINKIAEKADQNNSVFSTRDNLFFFLAPWFEDSQELYEAVKSFYLAGILDFINRGYDKQPEKVKKIVKKIQKDHPLIAVDAYKFWINLSKAISGQTMAYAVNRSPKYKFGRQSKSIGSILTGILIFLILLIAAFLILMISERSKISVRIPVIPSLLSPSDSSKGTETTNGNNGTAVITKALGTDSSADQLSPTETISPTATLQPTLTPSPSPMPQEEISFSDFMERITSGSLSMEKRYIVVQYIPEGRYSNIESVLDRIGECPDSMVFPSWTLQLKFRKDVDLSGKVELPYQKNIEQIILLPDEAKTSKVTISGKMPRNVIRSFESVRGKLVNVFEKLTKKDIGSALDEWCKDQIYLEKYSGGFIQTSVTTTVKDAGNNESNETETSESNGQTESSEKAESEIPGNKKSLLAKEDRIFLLLDQHDAFIFTNGVDLTVGWGITMKDISIYEGAISSKEKDPEKSIIDSSSIKIQGNVDAIYMGGFAFEPDQEVKTGSAEVEVFGTVGKIYAGGVSFDRRSYSLTDKAIIRNNGGTISEIYESGISFSADDPSDMNANKINNIKAVCLEIFPSKENAAKRIYSDKIEKCK